MAVPVWTTACPDWERRIVNGEPLIPCPPLFPDEAHASLEWFKALRLMSVVGQPTIGEVGRPWLFDFAKAIFGSYDPETGRRLIRYFFLLVSKKNAKSSTAAGIMLTALLRNWRSDAVFMIVAPTLEVAQNSFDVARSMVRADEELKDLLHIANNTKTITHRNTGASLKVIASDNETVSGKNATGILIDELWLFGKKANAENMFVEATGGLATRPEGFVIYLSTHSDEPPAGVFKKTLDEFRDIRDGKVADNKRLPVLYEFPRAMLDSRAYLDPANWHVTNPNLGSGVDPEFISDKLDEAQRKGEETLRVFLAKHLNVEIGQTLRANRWPGAEHWEKRGDKKLTLAKVIRRSDVIAVGVDGGGLDDLYGLSVLGRCKETGRWLLWTHAWCYRGVLTRRNVIATVLLGFEAEGELTIIDDDKDIDVEAVKEIKKVKESGLLAAVMIDSLGPHHELVALLVEIGLTSEGEEKTIQAAPQGIGMMSAIKTAELKVARGELVHSDSSCMAWAVSNLKIEPTATAIRATKQHAGDLKVDPAMSFFNAVYMMQSNPEAGGSIYEQRGLRIA